MGLLWKAYKMYAEKEKQVDKTERSTENCKKFIEKNTFPSKKAKQKVLSKELLDV